MLLTWLEPVTDGHRLLFARWRDGVWSEAVEVVSGPGFFANWADVPAVAEAVGGDLLVHWLAKTADATYAYGIELARSSDGGGTWERLGRLEDDPSPTEHGFVSFLPEGEGFRAVWLDGRETLEGGPMTLRTTRIGDRIEPSELLDARVCDCCPTAAVRTADGPLIAYRDRSPEEVRDVHVLRRGAEGWEEPRPVHRDGWVFPACPVNGPALAVSGERVVVAWFTAVADLPRVLVAFSGDSGRTFGEPVEIDRDRALGRVAVAWTRGGQEAVVAWLASRESRGEVLLRRVAVDGTLGAPVSHAATSASRASGVPRLVSRDGRLHLAWVEAGEKSSGELSRLHFEVLLASELPPPGA